MTRGSSRRAPLRSHNRAFLRLFSVSPGTVGQDCDTVAVLAP
jgi:hypothetical protein